MWYNTYCQDEQNTEALCLSEAAQFSQLNIVGKAPSMCGLTSSAVRLDNGSAHGGRFVMKKCTRCGGEGPFEIDKRRPSGLGSWCLICVHEGHRRWRENNRERILESDRKYREANREKYREANKRWREANPEKARGKKRSPEKILELTKKWQAANPEKVLESSRKYRRTHPEKMRERERRRRALEAGAEGKFTEQEWSELKESYGQRCVYCNSKVEKLEPDHIEPLSRNGNNNIANIVPACRSCNSSKQDTPLLIWILKRRKETFSFYPDGTVR
jgi:5-methylcytosine-specific restriction endonuclease McrA